MFYPVSSQLYANHAQPKSENIAQPLKAMSANIMPSLQQTVYGVSPIENIGASNKYKEPPFQTSISHPRLAPSSISSEEFLLARYSFSPAYNNNMAATREARTSNIHEDMPRFKDQVDLLA